MIDIHNPTKVHIAEPATTKVNRRRLAATAVAAVLAIDASLHIYWSTGETWPADDRLGLTYAVMGLDVSFAPRVVLPIAALLLIAASLVYLRGRLGPRHWLLQLGTLAVAGGLTFADARRYRMGDRFARGRC